MPKLWVSFGHHHYVKVTGVHLERVVLYEWDWEKTVQCIYGGVHLSLKSQGWE